MAVLWAFPYGSGYPLYLFCLYRTKKDAAAIPNAAFKYRNIQQTTQTSVVHIKSPFFARENSIVTQQPLSEIP
ncbi:MAG: hypothetical protein MK076_02990 [Flavobacteriales bacterium]|nr:hypothetical protein [Flavobacteriales bacterium]